MRKNITVLMIVLAGLFLAGCGGGGGDGSSSGGGGGPSAPTVVLSSYEMASPSTGIAHGNVTSDGGVPPVFERGICWGTTPNLSKETARCISTSAGTGEFSELLTDVTWGIVYYARAFASNSLGTGWSRSYQITLPH